MRRRQRVRGSLDGLILVDPEHELDVRVVPAIEMLRLREVGVASKDHAREARLPNELRCLIESHRRAFVGRPIAGAVLQEDGLSRVGEREQQGVVAPVALVRDVDPLLALAVRQDEGSIRVDHGFLAKRCWLLPPNLHARLVGRRHQVLDVRPTESTREVSRCRRIRNALRAERIQERGIATHPLEVLEAGSAVQHVERDSEHMVGLVIGTMHLQHADVSVDRFRETKLVGQQPNHANASDSDAAVALGELVADVGSLQHRFVVGAEAQRIESIEDFALARASKSARIDVHLKSPVRCELRWCKQPLRRIRNGLFSLEFEFSSYSVTLVPGLVGLAKSSNLPFSPDAFDTVNHGGSGDAFLARISKDGTKVDYATLLGGSPIGQQEGQTQLGNDFARAVGVSEDLHVWIGGLTSSMDFPVTANADDSTLGWYDGFLARFNFCKGSFATIGPGCVSPFISPAPSLEAAGCPQPGFEVSLRAEGMALNSPILVLLGLGTANLQLKPGCLLSIAPLAATVPSFSSVLGTWEIPFEIPSTVTSGSVSIQLLVADPNVTSAVASTNSIRMSIVDG